MKNLSSICNICVRQFSRTLGSRLESQNGIRQVRRYSVDLAHTVYQGDASLANVIIVHGLFGSKSNWRTLAKRLTKDTGCTTVTVDARNHGDSPHVDVMTLELMSQDIKSLVTDKLGLSSCILIGHSMGGKIAMVTSLIEPTLVDKLVVVDSAPKAPKASEDSWVKAYIRAMMSVDLNKNLSSSELKKYVDLQLQNTMPKKSIRQFIMKNLQQTDSGFEWQLNLNALLQNHDALVGFPQHHFTFKKPALFVRGGLSDYIQPSDYAEILRLFPSAVVETIEDAGHWVHSEKPNDFLNVVERFIENEQV
ncbi:protein ABHD11-like [Anneissia japonica]|uniref:protein ABHD11-like n=1 Tax=Anneissia japonica TaxID=1529436 RepID=UPI0014258D9E|nr:protein ABHD11-like [Anneissia japonica]